MPKFKLSSLGRIQFLVQVQEVSGKYKQFRAANSLFPSGAASHKSSSAPPAPAQFINAQPCTGCVVTYLPPLFVRGITEKNRRTIFMKVGTDELDVEFQSLRRKTVRGCGNLCGRHRLADIQRCWLNFSTLNETVRGRVPAILPSKCGLVATLRPG